MKTILFSLFSLLSIISYSQNYIWGAESGQGVNEGQFTSSFIETSNGYPYNSTNWSAVSISDNNGATIPGNAYWTRSTTGMSQGVNSNGIPLSSPTQSNGCAIFDSDFLDNSGIINNQGMGSSPSSQRGELISPRIALSLLYSDSALVLKTFFKYSSLNINEMSVSFSTDDGLTWGIAKDMISNHPNNNEGFTSVFFDDYPLGGASNLNNCRIKFTFEGDYNYVMLDDVSLLSGYQHYSLPYSYTNSFLTITPSSCTSYTSPSGNYTWNNSGVYYDTIINGEIPGAHSSNDHYTINLTINQPNTGTDTQIACDSYDWIDGNTYTASNNTATWLETNAAGCDSLVTLDLTITNSNTGTDVQTACDSYTWIDGITYTVSNNTATWLETNAVGCDSLVTLDLTINPLPDNNITQTGSLLTADQMGATYQWLDCNDNNAIINGETNQSYTPTPTTGDYAVEVTLNGCVDTSACFLVDYTGLSEVYAEIISVHPNPTSDILTISGLNEVIGLKGMKITSSTGEIVMKSNDLEDEFNVSELPTGVYFLNILHDAGIETIRFVKE